MKKTTARQTPAKQAKRKTSGATSTGGSAAARDFSPVGPAAAPSASEHQHQVAIVNFLRLAFPDAVLFAVPNSRKTSPQAGKRMKGEGVVAGAPDLMMFFPGGIAWAIEVKKPKTGRQSDTQIEMEKNLTRCGIPYSIIEGVDEAVSFVGQVEAYLKNQTGEKQNVDNQSDVPVGQRVEGIELLDAAPECVAAVRAAPQRERQELFSGRRRSRSRVW